MTVYANPIVMTKVATQRGAELRAQANRERLGQLAQPKAGRRQRWPDHLAAAVAVAALALLLAGSAAAQEPLLQTQSGLEQMEDQPETSAVQKVREAAS